MTKNSQIPQFTPGPPRNTVVASDDRVQTAQRPSNGFRRNWMPNDPPRASQEDGTDARRRNKAQAEYVEDFVGAVLAFLAFHSIRTELADQLARAVTAHATPVGSGTVARTKRISVEERAAAAVIAWMRHQTTAYDGMVIPREKGARREVRRQLAARSAQVLEGYRRGADIDPER